MTAPTVRQIVDQNLPGEAIGNDALAINAHIAAAGIHADLQELLGPKSDAGMYTTRIAPIPSATNDALLLHTREPNPLHAQFATWSGSVVLREHGAWWTPGRALIDPTGESEWHHGESLLQPLYLRADAVIATSSASAHRAIRLGAHADRVSVVPPLFPADQFARITTPAKADADPNILVVGRLDPHAGLGATLATFHTLASTMVPDAQLTIVGRSEPAWLYAAINETIGSKRLRCRMLGHVSQAELLEEFADATALLSLSEGTGFAVRVAEAMLAGVPVVTRVGTVSSNLPSGEHDAVSSTINKHGIVLDADDNETVIAQALSEVITNRNLRSRLIAGGRSQSNRFDAAANASRIVAILRPLLNQ